MPQLKQNSLSSMWKDENKKRCRFRAKKNLGRCYSINDMQTSSSEQFPEHAVKSGAARKSDHDVKISKRQIRSKKHRMLMYADDEEKDIRSIRSGAFGSSHSVRSRLGAQHNKAEMLYQNRKLAISDEKHKTKVLIARKGHFDFNTCRNAANHHCRQSPLLRDDDERVARRKLAISDEKHVGKVLISRKRHCHSNTWKNLAESAFDEDKDLHLKIKRRSQEESSCQSPLLRDDDERVARKKLAISDEKHVRKVLIARKRHCHFNTWKNLAESASDEDKDLHLKIKRRSQEESSCQSSLLRDDAERVARKRYSRFSTWSDSDDTDESDEDDEKLNVN